MIFPSNPSDKMLFESSPGIYYQYSAGTKSWYRVSQPSIPLATSFRDGLMSSEDFKKLTGLLIPPPQISLSTEDCSQTFTNGLLVIEGDKDGIIKVETKKDNLHENTGVIDFKVDTAKLADKLIENGNIKLTAPQGPQGCQGDPGDNGVDALPVGPQGPDGKDGKNAPWPGSLSEESFAVAQQGRAIVDIDTERVGPDENYIIVRRANIGNPNACPDTIIAQDIQSPWVLGLSTGTDNVTAIISPATGKVCGWACNSELYYFDMDAIVQNIHDHWIDYLNGVKSQKESLANTWLTALMTQFNEHKAALCCALEACRSRTRNVQTRQYIEQSRIAAAASDLQIVVGADTDKVFPPLDEEGNCGWNIAPTNLNLTHLSDPDCEVDWATICGI